MSPKSAMVCNWPGPTEREQVVIEDRTYLIDHPADPERIADHIPLVEQGYVPYWASLWPGAGMLGKAILSDAWTPGMPALEIGCGLGLAGVVALSVGLRVTFSDYDPPALLFAAHNARLNGFAAFDTLRLDWRQPPAGLQVPVLLASDLVYEVGNVEPLVKFIKTVLAPGGLCLMADQDRLPSDAMRKAIEGSSLIFTTNTVRSSDGSQRRVKGTLYRIRLAATRSASAAERVAP